MLTAASDVFASMFRNSMMEEQTGDVHIVGASRNSFRAFLEFVYLGEITLDTHTTTDMHEIFHESRLSTRD